MDIQIKIYPKSLFCNLSIFFIIMAILSVILVNYILSDIVIYVILFWIGFIVFFEIYIFVSYRIVLTNDKLIIRNEFNKTIINISTIDYIGYIHTWSFDYGLIYNQDYQECDYFFEKNKYRSKDLIKLFHFLNNKYNIELKGFQDLHN